MSRSTRTRVGVLAGMRKMYSRPLGLAKDLRGLGELKTFGMGRSLALEKVPQLGACASIAEFKQSSFSLSAFLIASYFDGSLKRSQGSPGLGSSRRTLLSSRTEGGAGGSTRARFGGGAEIERPAHSAWLDRPAVVEWGSISSHSGLIVFFVYIGLWVLAFILRAQTLY